MLAEIIIITVALLFLVLSVFLFNEKGSWLIAGYNTASEEERKKFDKKKLCRAVGFICLVCSIMLFIMAYMGYRVDSGMMNESMMLLFGLVFVMVVVLSVVAAGKYINTKAKK